MIAARTRPYLVPDPRVMELSPWSREDNEQLSEGILLSTWDPGTTLILTRKVQIDLPLMMESGKIPSGARLMILPTWWSPGTGLRGKGSGVTFTADKRQRIQFDLAMAIPGKELRDLIQVRTSVVLLERPVNAPKDQLAP